MDPNKLLEALPEAAYSDLAQAIIDKKGLLDGQAKIEVKNGRVHKLKWAEEMDLTPHNPKVDQDPDQVTIFEEITLNKYEGESSTYEELEASDRIDANFAVGRLFAFLRSLDDEEYEELECNGEDREVPDGEVEIIGAAITEATGPEGDDMGAPA